MSSYTRYLEDRVNLLEQECDLLKKECLIYKSYIEKELGDRIRCVVEATPKPNPGEGTCKVITIPEARYAIYADGPKELGLF